jgi:hypothetical protein
MVKLSRACWPRAAVVAMVAAAVGRMAAASGEVYSPRIISEHVADCSSLEAFSNFPAWKDLRGQQRALAVWKYFVGKETGVFHYNPIQEGLDPVMWEFRLVRDPIKMMNVYGYGFCGLFGPTTAGLFEGVGFEKARAVSIPGASHSVTEVWYDDDWHYYDTDLRGVIFRRDGKTVASIQDLLDDPTLLTNPSRKIDPFFPGDRNDPSLYAKSYREKPVDYLYHWQMGGSTMDYVLRKGESLTRWWQPQGGRWAFHKQDATNDFWKNLIKKEPYGAKGNHSEFSVWTHGNGLFDYNPVLRKGCGDFEDGVFEQKNVELTEKGIVPAGDAPGEVTWEVLSPYVIVPQVNSIETTDDDKEASVVTFNSAGPVTVSLSLDYGRSYSQIKAADKAGETSLDLTPHLKGGRYQYLVKFKLGGGKDAGRIQSLRIRTWVQLAPASLPRLAKGANHMQYATGDKNGYNTVPWLEIPNMGDVQEMARYWADKPKDYDPKRTTQRLKGDGEVVFAAPPGRLIQWMSLGGFFNAYQMKDAPKTRNEIWYAMNDSDQWVMVYRANVPAWHGHWHYAYDKEVPLLRPGEKVRVKYIGNPGVNGIRVNVHSIRPDEKRDTGVIVTHTFKMDGEVVEREFALDKPRGYTIDCASQPQDVSIRIEVPSDSKGRTRGPGGE